MKKSGLLLIEHLYTHGKRLTPLIKRGRNLFGILCHRLNHIFIEHQKDRVFDRGNARGS